MKSASGRIRLWVVALGCVAVAGAALAARISDVRGTKHNLSAAPDASTYTYINPTTQSTQIGTVPSRTVKATSETQVCVFCHTPHSGTPGVTPLWNRQLPNSTYTVYASSTLDANVITGQLQLDQPGGSSKLCLSCHDGTLAIGSVNVLNGAGSATQTGTVPIAMQGVDASGHMPGGPSGETSGFTRKLGIDLTNDHPISVTYNDQLATRDGELRHLSTTQKYPADGSVIAVQASGVRPVLPLEPTGKGSAGQIQCATCHDPHVRDDDPAQGNQKFLRQSRFQKVDPATTLASNYSPDQDIICLACHNKNISPGVWAFSAHANPAVADETYNLTATNLREFPTNQAVWQAACLNCHDTHTVQGARRLLREGTDAVGSPKQGGNSAIEETCYQCHTTSATSALNTNTTVPNVKTDFTSARHMPITSTDQGNATEVHDISSTFADPGFIDCSTIVDAGCGADFLEPRPLLKSRHAECTDCHNPHRVVKFQSGVRASLAGPPDKAGTHKHEDLAGYTHTNLISGVLRGSWGVEPVYTSASFFVRPTSFIVKRGDPGASTSTLVAATYVTREYQICLKCHSDYGYDDDNVYPNSLTRPRLGGPGLTPVARTNDNRSHLTYTNQARELQAPLTHQGELLSLGTDAGAAAAYNGNNHRSWHPVLDVTGRTGTIRGNGTDISANWRLPWSNAVGTQTMFCSDCHGSVTTGETAMPTGNTNTSEDGNPWGPHGSNNDFILKGTWNGLMGTGNQLDGLCFKCHSYTLYATRGGGRSGFGGPKDTNLHSFHADKIGRMRCSWCHVAVPHGWKNKALLVNLNDVGTEEGLAPGTQVRNNTTAPYDNGPYYMNAMNKIRSFATSGNWADTNCGSAGAPGNGVSGISWMKDSTENCKSPP